MTDAQLAMLQSLRDEIAAQRGEAARDREQRALLQAQVATVQAQVAAVVATLEQHRADDRRELDGLWARVPAVGATDQLHQRLTGLGKRTERLSRRQWYFAVVMAALAAATGAGAATGVVPIGGGG